MKRARIIPLTKNINEGAYPSEGAIRTIAVLPAIFKLYE